MKQGTRKKRLRKRTAVLSGTALLLTVGLCFGIRLWRKETLRVQSVWAQKAAESRMREDGGIFLEVPHLTQENGYPTGCECVSAAMLLQFWGYSYTVDEVIDEFLPMEDLSADAEGNLTGPSPNEAFVGNPRSENSYGCYAPVITKVLKKAVSWYHGVRNLTGISLDEICQKYLDEGMPVLIWTTIDMNPSRSETQWMLKDGSLFTWKSQEHCMVLTGYDEEYYYFNDPNSSGQTMRWRRVDVEERYEEFGRQAVAVV